MNIEKEELKQEINNFIEIRKSLWTVLIVLSGSMGTLFAKPDNLYKQVLIVISIPVWLMLAHYVGKTNREIKARIKQLR